MPIPVRVYHFIRIHLMILAWVLHYIFARRAWFLAPLILLLMLAGIFIFVSSNPAISPFLYALF